MLDWRRHLPRRCDKGRARSSVEARPTGLHACTPRREGSADLSGHGNAKSLVKTRLFGRLHTNSRILVAGA